MDIRFFHLADVHLGNFQYQNQERYNDFAKAFGDIIETAIAEQVAAVVIAGDVFHKRSIDALTLYQAKHAFSLLKAAGIPAIVIEGNHDKAHYRDAQVSWLNFLSWSGDLILLSAINAGSELHFAPWSSESKQGGYYDLPGGVRIYGVPWYGGSTAAIIERVGEALRRMAEDEAQAGVRYRALMLHTGVDGVVPNLHGLPTRTQFDPLRGLVDYIALGHVHKPYAFDDWLYNPGSTETVSAEEAAWKRGYYDVTVRLDDASGAPLHTARHVLNKQRPFLRWSFAVDDLASPEVLLARFTAWCAEHAASADRSTQQFGGPPVIDIALTGTLVFDPGALERRALEDVVRRTMPALHVLLRNLFNAVDFDPASSELDGRNEATRQELELRVFRDLLARDARYAPTAEQWAKVVAELKGHALGDDEPAAIAAWLREAQQRLTTLETAE
ncbi:MAG: exonuclease SbcCD subunit D [Ktedonobacterales bacterium]|nr:exonuclease SbcCD subunit D [Ktedonobacterales bacterium]